MTRDVIMKKNVQTYGKTLSYVGHQIKSQDISAYLEQKKIQSSIKIQQFRNNYISIENFSQLNPKTTSTQRQT